MTDRPTASGVTLRTATNDDRARLLQLVSEGAGGTAYRELPLYFLRFALDRRMDAGSRALVAVRGGAPVGCVLYGAVAGAVGTGRLHFITVARDARREGIGRQLCTAAVSDLSTRGARSAIAELPDDAVVAAGHHLLARCGFSEAARIPDYYRDGVALIVLHRPLLPSNPSI